MILPSLAGTQQGELGDLNEISAKGYESMGDDGRGKIDELFEEGLALGSAGVAGSIFSFLQRSYKEGKFFATGTLGRGQPAAQEAGRYEADPSHLEQKGRSQAAARKLVWQL